MSKKIKIIGVMSGKGGVGKTTIAASIAKLLSEKYTVGLLDVDITAPNIPGIFKIKEKPDINKYIHPVVINKRLKVFSVGLILPTEDQAVVWYGRQKTSAVEQSIYSVKWGGIDYLVVDTPPGTSDEIMTTLEMFPTMNAVVVSTPQYLSILDASRALQLCESRKIKVLGLIENMSGVVCPKCGTFIPLGDDGSVKRLANRYKVDYLGNVPFMPGKDINEIAEYIRPIIGNIIKKAGGSL